MSPGRRIERPLDEDAVASADEQLYAAHEQSARPNALFDADGNRLPLSATDPSQEALRPQWREYYFAALDAKRQPGAGAARSSSQAPRRSRTMRPGPPPPEPGGNDPGATVLPCARTHWIKLQVRVAPDKDKRPDFWPDPPNISEFAYEFYKAETPDGHKEAYLDADGLLAYSEIPAGDWQLKLENAFVGLRLTLDRVIRSESADAG